MRAKPDGEYNWIAHVVDHHSQFHVLWPQKQKSAEEAFTEDLVILVPLEDLEFTEVTTKSQNTNQKVNEQEVNEQATFKFNKC